MKTPLFAVAIVSFSTIALASPSPTELTLKRVTLSTAGVGYFEYEAWLEKSGTLRMPLKIDQVNDALRSLVVLDGGGQVAGISLQGRDSSGGDAKNDLPKAVATSDLLAQMIGTRLTVETGTATMSGAILGIEKFKLRAGPQSEVIEKHRVSLMNDRGVEQFVLEDIKRFQFADASLRTRLQEALASQDSVRSGVTNLDRL